MGVNPEQEKYQTDHVKIINLENRKDLKWHIGNVYKGFDLPRNVGVRNGLWSLRVERLGGNQVKIVISRLKS